MCSFLFKMHILETYAYYIDLMILIFIADHQFTNRPRWEEGYAGRTPKKGMSATIPL